MASLRVLNTFLVTRIVHFTVGCLLPSFFFDVLLIPAGSGTVVVFLFFFGMIQVFNECFLMKGGELLVFEIVESGCLDDKIVNFGPM